jgi:hypothetical protein
MEHHKQEKVYTLEDMTRRLVQVAYKIQEYHIATALGLPPPEGFEKGDTNRQNEILAKVTPMLQEFQETKKIDANSSSEVVKMLSAGKITPSEAIKILEVIESKVRVEGEEMKLGLKKEIIAELDKANK